MKTTSELMAEIKIKMAKLAKAISKQPEPQKPTIINNLWRKNNTNNRRSNKISLENSLKFFDIYKNLK